MEVLDFSLKKNNKYVIKKENIKCIKYEKGIIFILDKDKYSFYNNVLTKETNEEIITLDFNEKKCKVYLKKEKHYLTINITHVIIKNTKNRTKIEYIIETEKESLNIISLEYKKNS